MRLVLVVLVAFAGVAGLLVLALGDPRDPPPPIRAASTPAAPAAPDVDDAPLSGREEARVEAAALHAAGGGRVVELDRSNDPGEAYEVEVLRDGRDIDIALDARLRRVPNVRYDGAGGGEED